MKRWHARRRSFSSGYAFDPPSALFTAASAQRIEPLQACICRIRHCFSFDAALRKFVTRKIGAKDHFANGVPVTQIYGRTKFEVPRSIEHWKNV